MRKLTILAICCWISTHVSAQSGEPYFLSNPCLTPDGENVVFSFDGDLWKAPVANGQAVRLTAMQGYETNPRISPDGKWLAFTGRQMGNADVYLMPMAGGDIKQLTFHSATDEVNSWSWDNKTLYFTSNRTGAQSGYTIGIEGGTPKRLFGDNYFLYDHGLFENPVNGDIFFNDTWESSNQVARKRYKGPFNPDIQSYNLKTKSYKKYTDWIGKDFGVSLDKKGNVYFISDEFNGEYNLYTFENLKKKILTRFTSSIKTPVVNASGGEVVFEKDYQLWLYSVASGKSRKIAITLPINQILPAEKDYEVTRNISAFDISPDGKKMAFIARGELFVSDAEGKFVQQINKHNTERAMEVKWLSDNKTLLFNQTVNGYQNLFTVAADGSAPVKQMTQDGKDNRALVFNRKKTKAVYLSGRDEVRLLDLKTMESKMLVKDEIWAFQNADPGFSPNDEYVYFTAFRDFEQDIFVYRLADSKVINLTKTGVTETNPLWSPDGKYLYFVSSLTRPSYPFGMNEPRIYRMSLEKWDEPFRSDKYDELFKDVKKDTTHKETAIVPIVIDTVNSMDRIEQIGPDFGSQYLLKVLQKGDKTTVLYASNHAEGKMSLWKTVLDPFEKPKTEKITGTDGGGFDFAEAGDKNMLLFNGAIYKLNLDANKVDPVSISYTFRRDLADEFSQIFSEAWAKVQENYYDEHFHGVDWAAIRKKYAAYIPFLNNRADLRILLNDMLGELNSSHQGFSSFGGEESVNLSNRTMETGIQFLNTEPYTVDYVIKNSNADKASIDIKPGDVLVKVNDETVNTAKDRNHYFSKPSLDKEIRLTFNRVGKMVEVKIHPQPSIGANLYDQWIEQNQQRVDEKSKNRIAYHCMKNMGLGELDKFLIDMTRDFYQKDALILDIRYNTGGNVHDEVLKFLSQRAYLKWKYRQGTLTTQSNFAPADKPIILLTNEQSLSDAEMTAQGFKALKLGKIVGEETYHWIIFTSGTGLVDGSFVRLPSWGCYTLDGKDLEATGVKPDIRVPMNFVDRINHRDPQLDRAIEEILQELK